MLNSIQPMQFKLALIGLAEIQVDVSHKEAAFVELVDYNMNLLLATGEVTGEEAARLVMTGVYAQYTDTRTPKVKDMIDSFTCELEVIRSIKDYIRLLATEKL